MSCLKVLFDIFAVIYNYLPNFSNVVGALRERFGFKPPVQHGPKFLILEEDLVNQKDFHRLILIDLLSPTIQKLSPGKIIFPPQFVLFHHLVNKLTWDNSYMDRKYAETYMKNNAISLRRFSQRCYIVMTAISYSEGEPLTFYYYGEDIKGIYGCAAGYACCAQYRGVATSVHFANRLKDAESLCCMEMLDRLRFAKKTYWINVDFPDVDIAPEPHYVSYPSPYDSDDSD